MKWTAFFTLALTSLGAAHCGHVVTIDDRPCPCVSGYTCCSGACVAGGACPTGSTPGNGDASTADVVTPPPLPPGVYGAPCTNSPPTAGTPCGNDTTVVCVYGQYVEDACNTQFTCGGGDPRFGTPNTWQKRGIDLNGCAMDSPNTPLEATGCPSSYAAVAQGSACQVYDEDFGTPIYCSYPQGVCSCNTGPGGGGPSHQPQWVCSAPPSNCPVRPPHSGEACTPGTAECDYGSCVMSSSVPVFDCVDGAWRPSKPTRACF